MQYYQNKELEVSLQSAAFFHKRTKSQKFVKIPSLQNPTKQHTHQIHLNLKWCRLSKQPNFTWLRFALVLLMFILGAKSTLPVASVLQPS